MKDNKYIKLDLGCGNKKRPGTTGVDINPRVSADVSHNLNIFPYPFDASSVEKVYLDNTLEHLDSPIAVMEELYRIVIPGGKIKVIVPYFRSVSAFTDPTHKHFFSVESFSYYDPDHFFCQRYDYTLARFKTEKIVFNEGHKNGLIKKSINIFANKFPLKYERFLSQLISLDEISFYLTKT